MVYNTNYGQVLARWFDYYAQRFKVPLAGLHPPALLTDIDQIDVDASVAQIDRLVAQLTKVNGNPLDMDRLRETMHYSAQAAKLWGRILDIARNVPSPLTFFDTLIHVAPMVLMRGTPHAVGSAP